jgi:hypothetical protein
LALHNAQLTLEYQGSYDIYRHQNGSEPTYTRRPVRNPPFINLVSGFVFLAMTMPSALMSQKSAEYADNGRRLAPWWWASSLAFLGLAFWFAGHGIGFLITTDRFPNVSIKPVLHRN